jgi:hypothetical protein
MVLIIPRLCKEQQNRVYKLFVHDTTFLLSDERWCCRSFLCHKGEVFFFDRERHFIDHIISTSLLLSSSRMDIYALDSASLLDKSSRLSTITTHQIYLSSS